MATLHPAHEELLAFLTGALQEAGADEVGEHVSACPTCQAALDTIERVEQGFVARLRLPKAADPYADEQQCQEFLAKARAMVPAVGNAASELGGTASAAEGSPASAVAPLGQLGEYELLAKLGEGGMGTVYKARQTMLDKFVALKVLPRERMSDPLAVSRFEREMKAIGRLKHANIVEAHDAREIEGTTVLVMDYVDGLDLSEVVRRLGPLPIAAACELIRQTALGLQYAHQRGLVHRDIKPSNLMLAGDGEQGPGTEKAEGGELPSLRSQISNLKSPITKTEDPSPKTQAPPSLKILDLGLALLGGERTEGSELTSGGQAMGTADYMAPEQVNDAHSVDIRADIYSLGCTLYKFLTGHAPFHGPQYRSNSQKMIAHLQEAVPPVQSLRPGIPEGLVAVLDRMLAKDPAERFSRPADVAAAIGPFAAGADLPALLAKVQQSSEAHVPATTPLSGSGADSAGIGTDPRAKDEERRRERALATTMPRQTLGQRKRWGVAVGLAALALGIALMIVIRIKERSGRETVIEAPDGSHVTVKVQPDPKSEISNLKSPIPDPQSPIPPPAVAPFDAKKAREHQETWAKNLGVPVELTNSIGMKLVLIPPGEFTMGEGEESHKVTITKPFYLGKYEVTQEEWEVVMGKGSNGSQFKGPGHPMEQVSWENCQDFLDKLSKKCAHAEGRYRLPTEAQWEYACRSGSTGGWCAGESETGLDNYAWCRENSGDGEKTHPVGEKKPNAWGLYDMHGNVAEWCTDLFDKDYYKASPATDPTGPLSGSRRVNRGGSSHTMAANCRSASRDGVPPEGHTRKLGLRASLVLADKPAEAVVPPVTGTKTPGVELLDQAMLRHLSKIGCSAAAVAVSHQGKLVHSRGYGWIDQERWIPTQPNTLFEIGGCCAATFTQAAILQLSRSGKLNLDAGVFEMLSIRPRGKVLDDRVSKITIRNLSEGKPGWQGEPFQKAVKAARDSGDSDPLSVETLLGFLMCQKLAVDPGTAAEQDAWCCCFSFDVLRQVIEKASGKRATDYYRTELFRPFGLGEVKEISAPLGREDRGGSPVVWNAQGDGPVNVSAPALCTFMQYYWGSGEPRGQDNQGWLWCDFHSCCFCLIMWRSDGINIAILFNGCGNDDAGEIKADVEKAVEQSRASGQGFLPIPKVAVGDGSATQGFSGVGRVSVPTDEPAY